MTVTWLCYRSMIKRTVYNKQHSLNKSVKDAWWGSYTMRSFTIPSIRRIKINLCMSVIGPWAQVKVYTDITDAHFDHLCSLLHWPFHFVCYLIIPLPHIQSYKVNLWAHKHINIEDTEPFQAPLPSDWLHQGQSLFSGHWSGWKWFSPSSHPSEPKEKRQRDRK